MMASVMPAIVTLLSVFIIIRGHGSVIVRLSHHTAIPVHPLDVDYTCYKENYIHNAQYCMCYNALNSENANVQKYEQRGCNQKQKNRWCIVKAVLFDSTIPAHWQTQLSPEHCLKAFNTIT